MHPLTTLRRLNQEAEQAAHILNARAPAAPKPEPVSQELRDHMAAAHETQARILNGAKG
jgi:hypothetical protein